MKIPPKKPIPTLLKLISNWVPDLSSQHQIDPDKIHRAIPKPLRDIYALTGNYPVPYDEQSRPPKWTRGLFAKQDHLVPLDQLEVHDGRLTFIRENQGVWTCETLINAADPPVYSNSLTGGDGNKMKKVCESLSHFLTTFCLQELVLGAPHVVSTELPFETVRELANAELTDLWIDGIYAFKKPFHSFYFCKRGLLIMRTQGIHWLASNNEELASFIKTTLGNYERHSKTAQTAARVKDSDRRSVQIRGSRSKSVPMKTLLDDVTVVFLEQITWEEDLCFYLVEGVCGKRRKVIDAGAIQIRGAQELIPRGRRYVVRFPPGYVCFQKLHPFFDPEPEQQGVLQKLIKSPYGDFAKQLTSQYPEFGTPNAYRLYTMHGVIEVATFDAPVVESIDDD